MKFPQCLHGVHKNNVEAALTDVWGQGGEGGLALAEKVQKLLSTAE